MLACLLGVRVDLAPASSDVIAAADVALPLVFASTVASVLALPSPSPFSLSLPSTP